MWRRLSRALLHSGLCIRLLFLLGFVQPQSAFLRVALMIQLKQPIEHFLARCRVDGEPNALLCVMKIMTELEIGPPIRVGHVTVDFDAKLAHPHDIR